MTDRKLKRPRDRAHLAKLMVDIASGEVEDRKPDPRGTGYARNPLATAPLGLVAIKFEDEKA